MLEGQLELSGNVREMAGTIRECQKLSKTIRKCQRDDRKYLGISEMNGDNR